MPRSRLLFRLTLVFSVCLASESVARQDRAPQPAVPIEPIAAILDAFQSHPSSRSARDRMATSKAMPFASP